MRRLRDAGLLSQKGRGSATYYVPTDRLGPDDAGLSDNQDTLTAKSGGLSTNPLGLSTNPSPLPTNPPGLSTKLPVENEAARRQLLAGLPGDLAARVGALGRRSPPHDVQDVVAEVCRQRAWSAEELALLLARNSRHVRNSYLRPLMRDARLVMTNPDEPNDPQQAYRAAEGES